MGRALVRVALSVPISASLACLAAVLRRLYSLPASLFSGGDIRQSRMRTDRFLGETIPRKRRRHEDG